MNWDAPALRVRGDPGWRAERRLLQSWWRQAELRAEAGYRAGRDDPVGNLLTDSDIVGQRDLNFLHPAAYEHAERRIVEVEQEAGTLDEDRLLRNLLSSMPLCFNVFGALGDHPEFLWLFRAVFASRAVQVTDVVCEWSPRPKGDYLDDNTAFDAAVRFTDDRGARCLLGVEVKYADDFSPTEYDTVRYRDVSCNCGWFADGAADRLKQKSSNQLWRNTLLAAALEQHGTVDRAEVAVLCLADDKGAKTATSALRAELIEPDRVRLVSLEDLVSAARSHPEFGGWAASFARRYLDPIPGDAGPEPVGPAPPRVLVPPERDFVSRSGGEPGPSSWHLVAHLLGDYHGIESVRETHPGGGQYDCLVLLPSSSSAAAFESIQLNRQGSAFVFRRGLTDRWWWSWRGIWPELASGYPYPQAAALLAHHAGLERAHHPWGAIPLIAAAIGTLLASQPGTRCVHGLLDSSTVGVEIRSELFRSVGIDTPRTNDEASRWWFLIAGDGVRAAVDLSVGRATIERGETVDATGLLAALGEAIR